MNYGFIKVAAASPNIKIANCAHNSAEIVKTAWRASVDLVKILIFPELAVTGYTCGDLFSQKHLLEDALDGLSSICEETADLDLLMVVGVPLLHKSKLYNCAAVIHHGMVLGIVPKRHLPNDGEFCETRHFQSAFDDIDSYENHFMQGVPMGAGLLFQCEELPDLLMAIEIGADAESLVPPSSHHAAAGATIIANPSASNETIGNADRRKSLAASHSRRLACGYVIANSGMGESTTDLVFSGHNLIAENGTILKEAAPFSREMAVSEIDIDLLSQERRRRSLFPQAADQEYLRIPFSLEEITTSLTRRICPTPFIHRGIVNGSEQCETAFTIQATGLCRRLEHTAAQTAVLGVSGGLDSTLALLVAARAFEMLGRDLDDILCITMPGYGTTQRTRGNAEKLCEALGTTLQTIDITPSVEQHFKDISHDPENHNVVFENAQARMRTMILMDIANSRNGLVVGTGDMSELALGWATYNGDHMSMYNVNASVPKSLMRRMVQYEASVRPHLAEILHDILDTPVSPELLPGDGQKNTQETEQILGPYEIHDFFLYYLLRWGFSPDKILHLALNAFKNSYTELTILGWMEIFYKRFFSQQFKRNCMPDGPKISTISLSPRGDWHMPSDADGAAWLQKINELKIVAEKRNLEEQTEK